MTTNLFQRTGTALLALALVGLLWVAPASATESITYLHTDLAGGPVAATDASGNVVWREGYRPYGERTKNQAASGSNRQFFHDKPFDQDTGLSYFGARYYDPVVGRFMGVDPKGFDEKTLHSFNRYAYGNNNPYRFKDPNGQWAEDLALAVPGILVGSASLANNWKNDQYWSAAVDVAGLATDVVALLLPGVPGGAGLAIAATRQAARVTGSAAPGTTTLYRAVGPAELADIGAHGAFRNLGSAEGKYFTTSAEEAAAYAKQAVKAFGDPPYTIVKTDVPNNILKDLTPATVDRGVRAWVIPTDRLPGLVPQAMDHSPLPPVGF